VCYEIKTNKYIKQKYSVYRHGKISYKTSKARVSMIITYGGGQYGYPNKYSVCLNTPYQNPGYDVCTPWLYGAKKSTVINKLNNAKTTKW